MSHKAWLALYQAEMGDREAFQGDMIKNPQEVGKHLEQ